MESEHRHTLPSTVNPGFTVIEVLIALFLFSIGILSAASLQLSSIKGNSQANRHTLSGSAATNQIEILKSLSFESPELSNGIHQATPQGSLWVGWNVTDDVPLNAVVHDTNGQSITAFSVSKTIDVVVFSSSQGFNDTSGRNRLFNCSFIKTRSILNPSARI